jgi:predicted nucleic acid-binding protein
MTNKRVAWDACVWIALIQQERIRDDAGKIAEDRYAMCRDVIKAAEAGKIEIVTSALCYAEVCKNRGVVDKDEDKIAAFFENDYVLPVSLDRAVGETARHLMMSGLTKLKPADACHLATALIANVDEFHTFDEKLLGLDGKIDKPNGTKLKICEPDPGGSPAPLLEAMKDSPYDKNSEKAD